MRANAQAESAQAFIDKITAILKQNEDAIQVQNSFSELAKVAGKTTDSITEELRKPMASRD